MTFLLLLLATLHGQVTDPSGSAIPGAAVTVTQGTTVAARTLTDSQGRFQFDELQAGAYVLRVTAPGFAASETAINTLRDGQSLTSNVRMKLAVQQQEVIVNDAAKVDVDPASNAGALVMRGKDLEALSDDRDDLAADLQALAGPASGPNGGQIFIDGFTGGRLPPKSSILEVRVNSNPFAAQFDRPGGGRIEIITKPGADEYHGELQFRFSDDSLNSRNPFNPTKPPYQRRQWEGNITGPINKKTSFFVDFERKDEDTNAFVNALTLDANLFPTPFTAGIVQPTIGVEVNFRLDRQLSKKHSLSARYGYARDTNDNQGVGGFSLPSRAYGVHDDEDTWTVTDTGILNARTVNEIRMRFRSQRTRESAGSTLPTISVLDSFTSGGAPQLDAYTNQKRLELQETVSFARNKHVIRGGGRLRVVSLDDLATQNYAGTYTFTSLDSYRQTLLKTPGAGPSQFTLSGGDPLASVKQFDLGLFAQDDWRVRPNLTLSLGMRYETQNNIHDGRDFAPRAAFALGLGRNNGKAPRTVLRGGVGVFYDRFGESYTLEAERLNGIRQQQFVVPFPAFYPAIPSLAILAASRLPQAIRTIDSNLRVPASYQGAAAIERQLPKNTTLSLTYTETRGIHALRSRNIGVPPASDYYYEASGRFRQHQLVTNLTARVSPKFTLTSFYAWNRANSDTDSARTFPSSSSDLT